MRSCSSASIPTGSARPHGRDRELLAYLELHIEQGPVLEAQNLPVGVVTAIAGATRLAARLTGMAGHAGTVPMALRRDALAGAAECIGAVEQFCRTDQDGLVGTVGYIQARPGATNVIPGEVSFTIDIRAPTDMHRKRAVADIVRQIEAIAKRRQLSLQLDVTHENRTAPCASWLQDQIASAIEAEGFAVFELPSGAGHDGMAMIDLADVGMIFVRCRGGISHHPDGACRARRRRRGRAGAAAGRREFQPPASRRWLDLTSQNLACHQDETRISHFCDGDRLWSGITIRPMNSDISLPSHRGNRFYQGVTASFVANALQAVNFLSDRFLRHSHHSLSAIDDLYRHSMDSAFSLTEAFLVTGAPHASAYYPRDFAWFLSRRARSRDHHGPAGRGASRAPA